MPIQAHQSHNPQLDRPRPLQMPPLRFVAGHVHLLGHLCFTDEQLERALGEWTALVSFLPSHLHQIYTAATQNLW